VPVGTQHLGQECGRRLLVTIPDGRPAMFGVKSAHEMLMQPLAGDHNAAGRVEPVLDVAVAGKWRQGRGGGADVDNRCGSGRIGCSRQ